ncbi:hypothetical protein HD806DRAFT_267715 [Xylariaceae sp. AK1471]|nr:hypothetical protein HD806DRAFT_267715 [Xylariaceae sp. AK1471]
MPPPRSKNLARPPLSDRNELSRSESTSSSSPRSSSALAPPPDPNGRLITNSDNALIFRDSSISVPSRYSMDIGPEGETSASMNNYDLRDQSGLTRVAAPERSDEVDEQQSTVPVPPDFDYGSATLKSSPPSLAHRYPHVTRAGRNVQMPPVDGANSSQSDQSADSGRKTEIAKSSTDDDEYQLPESDSRNDESEESTIRDLLGRRNKTANKKSTKATYSSKARGKQVAKTKAAPVAAKKKQRPATDKTAASTQKRSVASNHISGSQKEPDTSPTELTSVRQSKKAPTENSSQRTLHIVPDSQEHASPLKSKSGTSTLRRPKKPFFQDHLSEQQAKARPSSSAHSNSNANQHSKADQGKTSLSPLRKTEPQRDRADQLLIQNKRTAPIQSHSSSKRQKVNNDDKLTVDKGNGPAIDNIQPTPTAHKLAISPIIVPSDRDTPFTDMEYGETHQQPESSHHTQVETSNKSSDFKLSEQYDKRIKAAPVIKDSLSRADVPTQVALTQFGPKAVNSDGVMENKAEAIETVNVEVYPFPQGLHELEEVNAEVIENNITMHRPLKRSRVSDAGSPSLAEPVTKSTRKDDEGPDKHGRIPLAEIRQPPLDDSLDTASMRMHGNPPHTASRLSTLFGCEPPENELNQADLNEHEIIDAGPSVTGKQQHAHNDVELIHWTRAHKDLLDPETSLHTKSVAYSQRVARKPHGAAVEKRPLTSADPFVAVKQQPTNRDLDFGTPPSIKVSENLRDMEDTLHPKSIVYARRLAERPRLEETVPEPPKIADETTSPGRTPITARESCNDPVGKWDTTLRGPRGAVFQSIKEVTDAVIRHLQSKETALDDIVENYRRNSHKLINKLLGRQSTELSQAAAAFDRKCEWLESLFKESARHAKMIGKKVSNEDNQDLKDWKQRKAKLGEAARRAREAVASI